MNETMLEKLARSTNRIAARAVEKIAKLDLRLAIAIPAAAGMMIAMYGIGQEVHGQASLLASGGGQALKEYLGMCKEFADSGAGDGVWNYVKLAVENRLPSYGGAAQGVGAGVVMVATPISGAAVLLSRGMSSVREWFTRESNVINANRFAQTDNPADALSRFRAGIAEGDVADVAAPRQMRMR